MDKKTITLLSLSVLANAFLGGFFISHGIGHDHGKFGRDEPDNQRRPGPPMIFEDMQSKLPLLSQDGQSKASAIIEKYKAENKANSPESGKALFDDAHAVLTADVLDSKKLDAIHKEMANRDIRFRNSIAEMITEMANSLSNEDRVKLFKDIMPMPPKRGGDKNLPRPPHDMDMGHGGCDEPPPPPELDDEK